MWLIFLVNMDHEKRNYGSFVPYATEKLPSQLPINVTSAESVSFCALLCLRSYQQCYTVAFNTQTRSCYLFSGFFFAGLISTPYTNIYTLQAYWIQDSIKLISYFTCFPDYRNVIGFYFFICWFKSCSRIFRSYVDFYIADEGLQDVLSVNFNITYNLKIARYRSGDSINLA